MMYRGIEEPGVDRRRMKVWIGGTECESIRDGLLMLRMMSGCPAIPYHVLYHAIRTGKIELYGVSISMSAPHARQERGMRPRDRAVQNQTTPEQTPRDRAVQDQTLPGRAPGPLLSKLVRSWLGEHH
jgi:hypothetical protein